MNAELRDCVAVPVPPGPAGVDALMPALSAALAGSGPAVAPLPTATSGSAGYRERILRAVQPGEPVPGHVAVVAATSGSTGDPAGVLLPESALRAAAWSAQDRTVPTSTRTTPSASTPCSRTVWPSASSGSNGARMRV